MNIRKKVIKSVISSLLVSSMLLIASSIVLAQDAPQFPVCSNPQGDVKESYNSGDHAIPGENSTRQGSDTVYSIGDGNYIQCFCAEDGSGIQTNWWRIPQLDQEQIETFIKLGWHFIPDGSDWGLEDVEYLAFNSVYSCGEDHTVTPTPTSTTTSQDNENDDNEGVGGVSDETGLVLAATGTSVRIMALFISGVVVLTTGIILRKRSA